MRESEKWDIENILRQITGAAKTVGRSENRLRFFDVPRSVSTLIRLLK